MLRLERKKETGKVRLRLHHSGFVLQPSLIKALVWALLIHLFSFLLFEIYPFKIEEENTNVRPSFVFTDLGKIKETSKATCDLKNRPIDQSLFSKLWTSQPPLPGLPIENIEWPKWVEEELEERDTFLAREEEELFQDLCHYLYQGSEI